MAEKLKFNMCNDFLMCEVIEIESMVGKLFIPETAIDKWRMEAIVLAVSPKVDPMMDDYKVGDRIVYLGGSHVLPLNIDDKKRIILHKKYVTCKIEEEDD